MVLSKKEVSRITLEQFETQYGCKQEEQTQQEEQEPQKANANNSGV